MAQETFSINWLSEHLSIDRRTLKKRLKRVNAVAGPQGDFTYRLLDVVTALYIDGAGKLDPEQARARKDSAAAERLEVENRVRNGELLEVAGVESEWSDLVTSFRAKMLGLHSKLANQLIDISNPAIIADRISVEISEALTDLAKYPPETKLNG